MFKVKFYKSGEEFEVNTSNIEEAFDTCFLFYKKGFAVQVYKYNHKTGNYNLIKEVY